MYNSNYYKENKDFPKISVEIVYISNGNFTSRDSASG